MAWSTFEAMRLTEWAALVQSRSGQLVQNNENPLGNCFAVISRKLGHKHDMPGTGQWVMHTDIMTKESWLPQSLFEEKKEIVEETPSEDPKKV